VKRWVVDTNVPIVANGRMDGSGGSLKPSVSCQLAAIGFLESLLRSGRILLDAAGEIQEEYHRHLSPRGQPGVGDRFYQEVLRSSLKRVERIDLPKDMSGSFVDFPGDPTLATFDLSDRKFAALGFRAKAPVAVATDRGWVNARAALTAHGLDIRFLCGERKDGWFAADDRSPAQTRGSNSRGVAPPPAKQRRGRN